MSKTQLPEDLIEEVILLETIAVLSEQGAIPKYEPAIQEKIDLLKEGIELDEGASTLIKTMGLYQGGKLATKALSGAGKAVATAGSGLASLANLGTAAVVTGLAASGLSMLGSPDEEEEEVPPEEKGITQKATDATKDVAKKALGIDKEREPFMRSLEDFAKTQKGRDLITRTELFLDIIGPFIGAVVPIYGDFIDILLAVKNFYKKDYVNGFLMLAAAIPGIGLGFGALSVALKTNNAVRAKTAAKALVETGMVTRGKGASLLADRGSQYVKDVSIQLTNRDNLKRIYNTIPAKTALSKRFGLPLRSFDEGPDSFVGYMIRLADVPFAKASVMRQMAFPISIYIQKLAAMEISEDEAGNAKVSFDYNQGLDMVNEQIHITLFERVPDIASKAAEKTIDMATLPVTKKAAE